jgi:endonuclease/exonuclease/phosphatase family metal-dependent hydrolase
MRLTFATLNAWGLPKPLARHTSERFDAIAANLPSLGADVVAFQEVWMHDLKERLLSVDVGRQYPWRWYQEGNVDGGGLVIFSRYPILEAYFEPFILRGAPQRLDHAEYYAGKGFVHLRLSTEAGPVSLINTHLHAQYNKDVGDDYLGIRAGQAAQLSVYLRAISDPLVLAGDFNFMEGRPVYRMLQGLNGLRDVAAVLDQRRNTVRRANPYRRYKVKPDSRKDFIFCRGGASLALKPVSARRVFDEIFEVDGKEASFSNHDGVMAELQLAGGATAISRAPSVEAVDLALALLQEGKRRAEQQRDQERAIATGSLAVGALALTGKARQMSRRRFMKGAMLAFPAVTVPSGAGYLALSEWHRPQELETYERIRDMLNRVFRSAICGECDSRIRSAASTQ